VRRHVKAARLSRGLRKHGSGTDDHGNGDRHVDQEGGPPGDPIGEGSAHEQSQTGPDPGGGGVPGNGAAARLALEVRGDQRQGGRRDDRGTDALHGPASDHPSARRREPDQQGRGPEDSQPYDEEPTPADDVAGPGAEQQQAAEYQGVGVLHP
jgi:hypothetical protein